MAVKPDVELYEFYRNKDAMVRAFVTAHYISLRAQRAAVERLREALGNTTNLTEPDIDGLIAAMEAKALKASKTVTDEELLKQLKEVVVPMVASGLQRVKDQSVRDKREKVFSASAPGVLKARKARKFVIFGEQTVTPQVGAVLSGPGPLVARALAAVEAGLGPANRFRTLWCRDLDRDAMCDKEPGLVTMFAPWWDHAIGHFEQFRRQVEKIEDELKGNLDLLLFDDLARQPKSTGMNKTVPHNFLDRAVWVFERLAPMLKRKGGAVVAGLKVREGERYDQRSWAALTEKCQLYSLYEENDLLYATDGYGNPHLIAEPGDTREIECPTPDSTLTTSSAA